MNDEPTKPPAHDRARRRARRRADRNSDGSADSDTKKVRDGANLGGIFEKLRRNPLALVGGTAGGGWLAQFVGELATSTPAYRWIFVALGVAGVLMLAGLDYLAALFRKVAELVGETREIREVVEDGFDEGIERFEQIEAWQEKHVEEYHSPKKPRSKSQGALPSSRSGKASSTAVDIPTIEPEG